MHTLQVLILLDLLNGKPPMYSTLTDKASSEDPVQWIDVLHCSENSESAEVHVTITEARDSQSIRLGQQQIQVWVSTGWLMTVVHLHELRYCRLYLFVEPPNTDILRTKMILSSGE